jgi:hypothetical protein
MLFSDEANRLIERDYFTDARQNLSAINPLHQEVVAG